MNTLRSALLTLAGLSLLTASARPVQAQQLQPAVQRVLPAEQLTVEPVTFAWDDLLQVQGRSALPAFAVEASVPALLELPTIEVAPPTDFASVESALSHQDRLAPCIGFGSEPALEKDFDSQLDVPDGFGSSFIPPNVAGGVGPDHLMTMLNNKVLIQDRLGASLSSVDFVTFWSPLVATTPAFPRVNYDNVNGRWVATARSGAGGTMNVMLAVSQTNDPTGLWDYYAIAADPANLQFPDWLLQGYNSTWIVMTANMFVVSSGASAGAKMWVVDRASIGGPLTVSVFPSGFMTTVHGSGGGSPFPSRALDTSDPDLWLVNDSFTSGGVFLLQLTRISGTGAAPVVSGLAGSPFGGSTSFCFTTTNWSGTQRTMTQAGDARFISPFSIRLASVVSRNGKIWSANSGGLPGPSTNTSPTSSGVIWRAMDPTLPFPASPGAPGSMLVQDGAISGGANTMALYPSLAVNCGDDVVVGYSFGDATRNPECGYSVRLGTDPLGAMGPMRLLKAGDSSYWKNFGVGTTAQWGFYTSCAVDPNDDLTLWTLQEYAGLRVGPADNDSRWATRWGRLGSCGAPTVDVDPLDVTVCVGDPASFSVSATASNAPLAYQWRKDGIDISGANASSYSIASTTAGDGGAYDVVVEDGCGLTTSLPASLSFAGATITTQPLSQMVAVGSPVTFTVAATGTGTLFYQWLFNGNPIALATSDSYTIASVSTPDYGSYSCVVTDDCGPVVSASALLSSPSNNNKIAPAQLSLQIFQDPKSTLACDGGSATFSVLAFPAGATYQWRFNGTPIVPPETGPSLVINPASAGDVGSYDVVVSLGAQSKTSAAATLALAGDPVITVQPSPGSITLQPGDSITYSVTATGLDLAYQWRFKPNIPFVSFSDLPGETGPTLVLNSLTPANSGRYVCVVSSPCGALRSRVVTLTIF